MPNTFLVSTQLGVHHSGAGDSVGIDRKKVMSALQANQDVYVFDTLRAARQFLRSITVAPSDSIVLNFFYQPVDYPIFEVKMTPSSIRNKYDDFMPEQIISNQIPIKVFTETGSEIKRINTTTEPLNVTSRLNLTEDQICKVHSAWGHRYSFEDESKEEAATCSMM